MFATYSRKKNPLMVTDCRNFQIQSKGFLGWDSGLDNIVTFKHILCDFPEVSDRRESS